MKKNIFKVVFTLILLISIGLFFETKGMLKEVIPMFYDAVLNASELNIQMFVVACQIMIIIAVTCWFRFGSKVLTPFVLRLWMAK